MVLSKREVSAFRQRQTCAGAFDVPYLRYVQGGLRFNPGGDLCAKLPASKLLQTTWEDPNDLENSEDRRGAGGHGNQHVRLRRAQIDCIETICPARGSDAAASRGRCLCFKISPTKRHHDKRRRYDAAGREAAKFARSAAAAAIDPSGEARIAGLEGIIAADLNSRIKHSNSSTGSLAL